ncbi:MAG: DUF6033 family protein [Lachnoclostridium sp.]|nr:DUF6033 family protein [Lachnospira sp.]MCM1247397.1 DUF6033 family protein [Lachnoclostridium sp.]MCM1536174.1 DUF6033 family protein [Clostridium sp.]
MGMEIYQNYSQFYRGTEPLKTYGDGKGKKDTLVKYEFNTTDEHGNKIMDKMTREETLQVMKEISAQYGDNVMIQFSGDGMAALVENRKGQAKEAMTDEQRAAKAARDVAFANEIIQNEHREVAPEHISSGLDYNKIMHEKSPEIAESVDQCLQDFSKTKDMRYMQRAAKLSLSWFRDSYAKHKDWFEEKEDYRTEETNTSASSQPKLSSKAQKLLEKLKKMYKNMDFMVADFKNAEEAKAALAGGTKEISVLFSVEELEKMASSEKYEKEYMDRVQDALRMSDEINRQFGFTSAFGKGEGSTITKFGISFNADGTTSFFAELEKSSASQREYIEKMQEEKRAQKREDAKRTTLQADSLEELLEKMRKVDWSAV